MYLIYDLEYSICMSKLKLGDLSDAKLDHNRLKNIDSLINRLILEECFPGAVIAVGRNNVLAFLQSYGYASLYPAKEKMTIDKVFDLASLTKVVCTTSMVMKAVEDGLIRLDDPISYFIPTFSGEKKDKVTIWHLLTHTSGLPPHVPLYSVLSSKEDVIDYISKLKLEYTPGTKVVYSDLGFILLGTIIEKTFDTTLDVISQEKIFIPLGMNDTMFNPKGKLKERAVTTEYCKLRKRFLKGEVHDENSWFMGGVAGHAGLFSTAFDLSIFAQMLLNGGVYDNKRIFSKTTIEEFTRIQTGHLNKNRALGWTIKGRQCSCGDLMSSKAFGHTGFTGTSIWIDPTYNMFIILLTNRVHPTRENECILRARPLIHNYIMSTII